MPHCYFVNDYRQSALSVVDAPAPNRSDHGLPIGGDVVLDGDDTTVGKVVGTNRASSGGWRGTGDEAPGHGAGKHEAEEGGGERGGGGGGAGAGGGIVLCNFNRLHKIDPHTFGAWMEVCWGGGYR